LPAAPSNLTATAGKKSVTLNWMDNSSNETGVKIERSTDGVNFSQITTTGANVTSYKNTGLTSGTTYYYRVRATNTAGDSAYSNTASAIPR
jgi:predicted phage tail protein